MQSLSAVHEEHLPEEHFEAVATLQLELAVHGAVQVPPVQIVLPVMWEQSASAEQAEQVPEEHRDAEAVVQCEFAEHW